MVTKKDIDKLVKIVERKRKGTQESEKSGIQTKT